MKVIHYSLFVTMIVLTAFFIQMAQPQILGLGASTVIEQNEIQNAIYAYFDARYRSMSSLELEDLNNIIDTSAQGAAFLKSEVGKLEIEIKHAKLRKLGYMQYKMFLDFKNFVFLSSQSAVVTVVEGHDVVFEISKEISKTNPIVSKMRNLQHTIAVSKVEGTWKILSDNYEDDLWRLLKIPGNSQEELLFSMNDEVENTFQPATNLDNLTTQCSLPADTTSYSYNRIGAVIYAHQWALAPRPYNSPPYTDYTDAGGDCTNFVNQAIHDGGNAQMVFGGTHGTNGDGQLGWYFYSSLDHATAWNYVTPLMEFITQYWVWSAGPEGCEVSVTGLQVGDLIQYDWEGTGNLWDHSVIVVNIVNDGSGVMTPYIASHTPDLDNYPYFYFFDKEDRIYRYIHIERIDGSKIFMPAILANMDNYNFSPAKPPFQNAYPAPIEDKSKPTPISPYPVP